MFLDTQLGLGDLIIQNGLIRELSRRCHMLTVPCHSHNLSSAQRMFKDLENVQFCTNSDGKDEKTVIIGQNNPRFGSFKSFDVAMYALSDVPFECRWSSFYVRRNEKWDFPLRAKSFRLFHHDPIRGFKIKDEYFNDDENDIVIFKTKEITDWIPYIEQAREIHCIDSSILHLVESVNTDADLFYHKYARKTPEFGQALKKKDWMVIE